MSRSAPHIGRSVPHIGRSVPHMSQSAPQIGRSAPHIGRLVLSVAVSQGGRLSASPMSLDTTERRKHHTDCAIINGVLMGDADTASTNDMR